MPSFLFHILGKGFNVFKKVILVVAVYFIVINLFLVFTKSDVPSKPLVSVANKNRDEVYKVINDPKLQKTDGGKIVVFIYRSFTCIAVGEGCTNNPADGEKNFRGSLTGKMSNLIATPYANPPSSGVYWVYSGLQHAGFVPQAYAAEGIGFAAIRPFMTIWKVFRDVSYLLLVLILIAIGFMIMFRMKLNPQTVISIESALPRIVITLILITFSFAIAGFLIDMMYLLIALVITTLAKADPSLSLNPVELQNQYMNAKIGTIWDGMFPNDYLTSNIPLIGGFTTLFSLGTSISSILPSWIDDSLKVIASIIAINGVLEIANKGGLQGITQSLDGISVLGTGLGNLLRPISNLAIIGPLLAIVVPLTLLFGAGWIIGILMLFTMLLLLFRIFFLLFTTYLRILLLITVSPLILLFEAIPGRNTFQTWLKSLVVDLLTFPLVIGILVFGRVLVNLTIENGTLWTPPFIYAAEPKAFTVLLGMGIIFMIPDLNKFMRQALGVKDMPIGLSMGTFFAGVGAGVGGGIGLVGSLSSLRTGLYGLEATKGGLLSSVPGLSAINSFLKGKSSSKP